MTKKVQIDYREVFNNLRAGELAWLFEEANQSIFDTVSADYIDWLAQSGPVPKDDNEFNAGMYMSQHLDYLRSLKPSRDIHINAAGFNVPKSWPDDQIANEIVQLMARRAASENGMTGGRINNWGHWWSQHLEEAWAMYDAAQHGEAPRTFFIPFSWVKFLVMIVVLMFVQGLDIWSNLEGAKVFVQPAVIAIPWGIVLIISSFCEQIGRVLNKLQGAFTREYNLRMPTATPEEGRDLNVSRAYYWVASGVLALLFFANMYYSYLYFSNQGTNPLMGIIFTPLINSAEWIIGREIWREWKKR